MITRVRIQGYKCLRDVTVPLGPFNVLIGPNDAGKSSFMQALAEPSKALLRRQPTDVRPVSKGGWTVELDGATGTLTHDASHFNAPAFRTPAGRTEQLNFLSQQQAVFWFAKHAELGATDPVSLDAVQVAAHSPATFAKLDLFVSSRGSGTASHLAALALGDRDRFDAIEAATRDVTKGRVKNIVVKDIGSSTYALSFKLADGTLVQATEMSHGVLLFVGFQALVQRDGMPGVLLIEEPERGLHPRRLAELVGTFRKLTARGVQVIFTTHSPDILSSCKPDEVRIFHRPEPESPTEVLLLPSDFEQHPRDRSMSLGQLWTAHGEAGLLDETTEADRSIVVDTKE